MNILDILDELAADGSRLAKEAILKREKDNLLLKKVFVAALDQSIQYYIRKIPPYTGRVIGSGQTLSYGISCLDALADRTFTGHAAVEFLNDILNNLSFDDAIVVERIIKRDLRCGVSESTVNKIWPGLIKDFPYMRCSLLSGVKIEKFSWKDGVYSQLKADGMFVNCNVTEDSVHLLSRAGSEFPIEKFEKLATHAAFHLRANTQTHGELLIRKAGVVLPRTTGNGIFNSVLKGGDFAEDEEVIYEVWDQIPLDEVKSKGIYEVPYSKRLYLLTNQLEHEALDPCIRLIETKLVYSMEEALEHYQEKLAEGFEGTIIKDANFPWKDGTSKFQVKMKLFIDVDLIVVGFNPGNGKNADTFGSIECESSDGLLTVNATGFTDEQRIDINNRREEILHSIVTVKSNMILKPKHMGSRWSMFLPNVVEFRQDKKVADSLEQIQEQFANAIAGK
jgi:DNA ligase-1